MAAAAGKDNKIDGDMITAMMDRMAGLEQDKINTMMAAVAACKPFVEQQREIREEAKEQGIRIKVFNAAWGAKKAMITAEKRVADLEDDDAEQMSRAAEAIGGPLGEFLKAASGNVPFK